MEGKERKEVRKEREKRSDLPIRVGRGAKRQAYLDDKCGGGGGGQKAPSLSRFDPASPADRIFPARCAVAHARYSRNEGVRAA